MSQLDTLASLERELKKHPDATLKNIERLQTVQHPHTAAMCKAITALLRTFPDRKIFMIVEAEISRLARHSRPEDFVVWIETIGIFVLEVKSHSITGIRSFENSVPQVIYGGQATGDHDLLDQPRSFAYDLRTDIENLFEAQNRELPALYYAGWLPNVSPEDVAAKSATVALDKVWLSDMLEKETFIQRLGALKNITRGTRTERDSLQLFCSIFGTTSGLKSDYLPRVAPVGSIGQAIDRKNQQLKRLTWEQETLAFNPNLVRGPKVIRGVAGSGKTVVLVNAVAEQFIRALSERANSLALLAQSPLPQVLVLCFNRALAGYLKDLIVKCFESRKPVTSWTFPHAALTVMNIDRLAYSLGKKYYHQGDVKKTVADILNHVSIQPKYQHLFIDEGQDINLDWYPLIQALAVADPELGKSIIVFYDEAQNIYGVKRPGRGDIPAWESFLGSVPSPRGLKTVMRVGHRNTNQILSFSFNLLLGSFAAKDPQMKEFAGLTEYEKEIIPWDPALAHPRAGQPCVERIDERQVKVNFAVHDFSPPNVHAFNNETDMLSALVKNIQKTIDINQDNVEPADILIMAPLVQQALKINQALNSVGILTHSPIKTRDFDGRDLPVFQEGRVTVSTIKSAKGYTAHVCHLVYLHSFEKENMTKEEIQQMRTQIHVACTRSSLYLDLWGTHCSLINEARQIRAVVA
ncbi:MAG: hypothetical protein VKN60_10665 [Cyanobacteriota bacterium]|nr:hypothetical protein [Cyanobacteriota bacterium]